MCRKKQIRRHVLKNRRAMAAEEWAENSFRVTRRFADSGLISRYQTFHLYYPINREVDTRELFELLIKAEKTVLFPRTDFAGKVLDNYRVYGLDQLEKTSFNMMEPKTSLQRIDEDPQVVIVPGVAFDKNGARLGYGGGFYDRFLENSRAVKAAFAFDMQVLAQLPSDAHDISMDWIFTESATRNCAKE